MKFFAVLFLFALIFAVSIHQSEAGNNIRTSACDEVCHRSQKESESCCKAHGFGGGGRCKNFEAFCDN